MFKICRRLQTVINGDGTQINYKYIACSQWQFKSEYVGHFLGVITEGVKISKIQKH